MIRELDTVVLVHDIEEHSLERNDIGAVVHCYEGNRAFEAASHPVLAVHHPSLRGTPKR